MSWAVGFDTNWNRDIGYGVPAVCDHPGCEERIDRGLSYVCGGKPYGGDEGCGLYFCEKHLFFDIATSCSLCARCAAMRDPFEPKPDLPGWINWKLTDESWASWREDNPGLVEKLRLAS